jgi:hypothetical protein
VLFSENRFADGDAALERFVRDVRNVAPTEPVCLPLS